MTGPLASIVIPTLREAEIGQTVDIVSDALAKVEDHRFEIVIVDDSDDSFRRMIRDYIGKGTRFPVELIEGHRRGKGDAIRLGVLATRGDAVLTMDADLPVPVSFIEPFIQRIDAGVDVVIAERPASRHAARPLRSVISRTLRVLQQRVVFRSDRFSDTQCGFKAFSGPLIREMASRQIVEGGMVDVEYLYMAILRGATIEVVPVPEPIERPDTRINLLRCVVFDPVDLVRIRAGHRSP